MGKNKKGIRCGHRGNFTLLELLIVVSIIAILTGMLLPALNSAREKAYTITCTNITKQYALAANQYASDWKDLIPGGSNAKYNPGTPNWGRSGLNVLNGAGYLQVPHVRQNYFYGIFPCPSQERYAAMIGDTPNGSGNYRFNIYGSYGINRFISGGYYIKSPVGQNESFINLASFPNPSRHAYFADHMNNPNVFSISSRNMQGLSGGQPDGGVASVHQMGANFNFLDGHTQRIGVSSLGAVPTYKPSSDYVWSNLNYPW